MLGSCSNDSDSNSNVASNGNGDSNIASNGTGASGEPAGASGGSGGSGSASSAPAQFAATGGYGWEGLPAVPFTVVLAEPATSPVSFTYTTSDGSAEAGLDYEAVEAGVATIPAGQQSTVIEVKASEDGETESDETVNITITPSGDNTAGLSGAVTATGIIKDNNHVPALSVTEMEAQEGDIAQFQITLLTFTEQSVTVEYETMDASATAGEDYVAASGSINIVPGAGIASLEIETLPDDRSEIRESFLVSFKVSESSALLLGGPGGGPIEPVDPLVRPDPFDGPEGGPIEPFDPFGSPFGIPIPDTTVLAAGLILDEAPTAAETDETVTLAVEISDASAGEGDPMTFTVTLPDIMAEDMSFRYQLYGANNELGLPGTAGKDIDFIDATGRIIIPAGSISGQVQVRTLADNEPEGEEIFTVRLDDPMPAQLGGASIRLDEDAATGTGTIYELN